MSARQRPPQRRPQITVENDWRGTPVSISVGVAPDTGRAMEVFVRTNKVRSDLEATLCDGAIAVSIAPQFGATAKELSHSMGQVPDHHNQRPASPLGMIVEAIHAVEATMGG